MALGDRLNAIISPRLEASLRATAAAFAGYCLSVAAPTAIIPQTLSYMIGLCAGVMAISFPSLVFSLGAVIPAVCFMFIFALGASSAMQCAAHVSNGFLTAMYAIYSLWISSLKHGPTKSSTAGFAAVYILLPGMMALSFRTLIQDGLSFSVAVDEQTQQNLKGYVLDHIPILEAACQEQGLEPDCWKTAGNLPTEFTFTIPSNVDMFGGQDATLNFANFPEINISIPGGLWIVAGLWKWQGLDNPLANNRNLMIAVCWSLVCVVATVLLIPPLRTIRKVICQMLAPAALQNSSKMLEKIKSESATSGSKTEEDYELEHKLVHDMNLLGHGENAVLTTFEPRLIKAPLECSWPKLQVLLNDISRVSYSVLVLEQIIQAYDEKALAQSNISPPEQLDRLQERMSACSVALAAGKSDNLESLIQDSSKSSLWLDRLSSQLVQSTHEWLDTMENPPRASAKDPLKTYVPWIAAPLPTLKRLLEALTIPFRPKLWNSRAFLTTFKFVVGYVVLFIMSIYWEGYANFALNIDNLGVTGLYSGWQLTAYSACWLQTLEGSIKKGVARLFGTALGAFMGWLGVIVASGSYDLDAEINPYGLVTWLTVWFFLACHYFTFEKGLAARMGKSSNYGNVGSYFSITMSLVALEVQAGAANRDDVAVNRLVATLSGVLMCSIISLIPPFVRGGDPQHTMDVLEEEKKAMQGGLEALLEAIGTKTDWKIAAGALDDRRESFVKDFSEKRKEAQFLLKDASSMHFLPFLRIDPDLGKTLEHVSVLGGSVALALYWANFLCTQQTAEKQGDSANDFSWVADDEQFREQLESILKDLTDGPKDGQDANGEVPRETASSSDPEAGQDSDMNISMEAFIALLKVVVHKIDENSKKLSDMM